MKAITFETHGGPDVLTYVSNHPTPTPGPGEVLVRLRAAALNRLDLWVREGWPGIRLTYPHIPGADGAGEIAAVGIGVTGWKIGQRVVINSNIGCGTCAFCLSGYDNRCTSWQLLGETRAGTYAEYVVVPQSNLLDIPSGFDLRTAAAASLVYHTAWHSLIKRANLRAGERVLIVGASGGVNTACIQIAKFAGAEVFVIGSSPAKLELAASLGADFLINRSQTENWAKEIYRLTQKQGIEVVVDNVGTTYPQSMRAAARGGRIVTVGNTGNPTFEFDNRYMFAKHLSLLGSSMGTKKDFAEVMALIFANKLQVPLGETFPLHEARAAQIHLGKGEQLGKITLDIP
jgi:NADPH:quinone reductase-like Zn-dependent oxidoreductase